MKRNFIPINEGFICEACGADVPPAKGTFRNHCPFCLTAKHVDENTPGDRASHCGGLMPTIAIEGTDPENLDLIHRCEQCGKTIANKIASDDNKDQIFALIQQLGYN